ncbi:unnamed protein product [Dracunculus medinensis]|uniref:LOB domain-containing protein n=1 Tax=Dracunculus medinensis TaxID=318479 RepID=A0A0N4UFC0_DRAME|nr:unnamed protein product [Dracunculus medinensis]
MLACALCVANPNACRNPSWYTNFCFLLQAMYPEPKGRSSPQMSELRSRIIAMQAVGIDEKSVEQPRLNQVAGNRATVAMLAPAVHIMHQIWKGMAWVTDGIDEDDIHLRNTEQEIATNSVYRETSQQTTSKIELNSASQKPQTVSSDESFNSKNDITL